MMNEYDKIERKTIDDIYDYEKEIDSDSSGNHSANDEVRKLNKLQQDNDNTNLNDL